MKQELLHCIWPRMWEGYGIFARMSLIRDHTITIYVDVKIIFFCILIRLQKKVKRGRCGLPPPPCIIHVTKVKVQYRCRSSHRSTMTPDVATAFACLFIFMMHWQQQHREEGWSYHEKTKKQMIGCQCNDMMCCTIDEDVPRGELRRRRITHHLENVLSRCIPSLSLSSNATVPPIARQQARAPARVKCKRQKMY